MNTKRHPIESGKVGRWESGLTLALLISLAHLLTCSPVAGDLVATVTPGKQFRAGETPTTATLNALGRPTITITGTIGGTNANLAANSLNGTHMVDTFAGSNLTWDASSPRRLVIANDGVGPYQLSTSVAGLGLGGGGATALSNKVNAATGIAIQDDTLALTNVPVTQLTVTSNYLIIGSSNDVGRLVQAPAWMGFTGTNFASQFISAEYSIAAGNIVNTNHNLIGTPFVVRAVLVCKTANNGYSVGDELDVQAAWYVTGGFAFNEWAFGANATNVFVTVNIVPNSIFNKTNSNAAFGVFTPSEWRAKIYARP